MIKNTPTLPVSLREHSEAPVAPVIETARLVLRGHLVEDFPECAGMWADAEVTRHIGETRTAAETWAAMRSHAGQWALLGYGYWVVEDKATSRTIGEVGFGSFMRDIVPPIDDMPEAGWVLARWAHGKGYATEAVKAALCWADAHFEAGHKTVCIIREQHAASLRVAEKCGYREYARTTFNGAPNILLRR